MSPPARQNHNLVLSILGDQPRQSSMRKHPGVREHEQARNMGTSMISKSQAAALAATLDRTPFVNLSTRHPLLDLNLLSVRRPPSLDFYLSWMSPVFR
jgi:hypothetical protein